MIQLFETTAPSVVQVTALSGLNDKARFAITLGSGFIWDIKGYIVTNDHVVRGAESITISLAGGNQLDVEVIGLAPNYDLAVLRLKHAQDLPTPIPRGRSGTLRVGQFAYAIGSPFGLDQSLTTGVISALRRQLPTGKGHEIDNMIQTSAAIFPGNSGGPLLDSAGRLIGVNTVAYLAGQPAASLGFAIPVDVVSRVVPELIRAGRIPTAGIGIVPERNNGGRDIDGVLIAQTIPGSPAERAGLLGANAVAGTTGDVIVRANREKIRSIYDFTAQLEHVGIGSTIEVEIERQNKIVKLAIEVIDIDGTPSTLKSTR